MESYIDKIERDVVLLWAFLTYQGLDPMDEKHAEKLYHNLRAELIEAREAAGEYTFVG